MCTDNSADGINSKPPSASFDIAIIQQQFIDFLSFLFFQASYGKGVKGVAVMRTTSMFEYLK